MSGVCTEGMLEDALSSERSLELALSRERCAEWDARTPRDVRTVLALCAALRALFGDPPVDERPWRGSDFRL